MLLEWKPIISERIIDFSQITWKYFLIEAYAPTEEDNKHNFCDQLSALTETIINMMYF